MADPRFGTTGGHLAAMNVYWSFEISPHYYEGFLMGLAEQNVRLLPSGNAGVVEQVATGEADVGMTDTDDVWAAQAHGLPVDLVYARHEAGDDRGGGALLIPNTVALVKGGPNTENAKKLIDFLLSEEVEFLLAESQSHNIPIRPGLAEKYPQYAVPDPLKMSYEAAAGKRAGAIALAMELVGEPDGAASQSVARASRPCVGICCEPCPSCADDDNGRPTSSQLAKDEHGVWSHTRARRPCHLSESLECAVAAGFPPSSPRCCASPHACGLRSLCLQLLISPPRRMIPMSP
jgi:hypothetical protein